MEGSDEHYANLAEFLPDQVLSEIGSDLSGKYMDYQMGRKEWERTYTTGLDLLGFKYDMRTDLSKEHRVLLTQFLQKLLHNFKRWHIKNYYRLMGLSEHNPSVHRIQKKQNKQRE